jgi:Transposase zinc-ribbon domain
MLGEYPRNLTEPKANFGSAEACRSYLARLRWPSGFACPRYGPEAAQGFVDEVTRLRKYMETSSELLPHVHLVISLLVSPSKR